MSRSGRILCAVAIQRIVYVSGDVLMMIVVNPGLLAVTRNEMRVRVGPNPPDDGSAQAIRGQSMNWPGLMDW